MHTQHGGGGESMTMDSQHSSANFPYGNVHPIVSAQLLLATLCIALPLGFVLSDKSFILTVLAQQCTDRHTGGAPCKPVD